MGGSIHLPAAVEMYFNTILTLSISPLAIVGLTWSPVRVGHFSPMTRSREPSEDVPLAVGHAVEPGPGSVWVGLLEGIEIAHHLFRVRMESLGQRVRRKLGVRSRGDGGEGAAMVLTVGLLIVDCGTFVGDESGANDA
jgi:hypothetical protein